MPKGFTAQLKGTTAKPSGTQENLDSSRPIEPTTKPKGNTTKPSGTLKISDPERSVGHTAQPKGTTAKPSGNTAQPKGNTAKPSGITKHQENENRLHTETLKSRTHLRKLDIRELLLLNMMISIKRRTPKGSTAKPTGRTAKRSGDHLTPGTPATGQAATSSTAVGESSAQKRKGKTNVYALNKMNTTTEYIIATHIQILSTDMTKYIFSKSFRPLHLPQSAGERRLEASRGSRDQLAWGHRVSSKGVLLIQTTILDFAITTEELDHLKKFQIENKELTIITSYLEHKQRNTEPAHSWKRDTDWPDVSRTTSSTKKIGLLKTATTHDTETTGITRETNKYFKQMLWTGY